LTQISSRRAGARQILEGCWGPIRNAIEPRIADLLIVALGPLAKSDDEAEARKAKQLLARDRAFLSAYSEALHAELTAAIGDFVAHRTPSRAAPTRSLSLVGYDDMEFLSFLESAGGRLLNLVADAFASIKLRILDLVREDGLADAEMPLRPTLFVRPLRPALEAAGVAHGDLLSLMRQFIGPLGEPVAQAFRALDHHLAGQGLSSELIRQPRPRPPTLGGPAWGSQFAPAVAVAPKNAGFALSQQAVGALGADPLQVAGQMLQFLSQRLGGTEAAPLASASGGAASGYGASAAGAGAAVPATDDGALMQALGEIQRVGALAFSASLHGAAPAADFEPARARHRLQQTATRQVDRLTIELVGLLFERIARDRHVPGPIRDLIGGLQFPLMRAALTDPDLFLTPDRPARRLLDRIATTAVGWTAEGEDNQRYLAAVQQAVQTVLADVSSRSFESACTAFETFVDAERTRDDDPVQRAKRALEKAENREIQVIRATMQVRSAFDGVQLESYLRDFLLETWVRVLVVASERPGGQPTLVRRMVSIVPDLVWTVQPKLAPSDRKRMLAAIPPVLTVLREGLKMIEWPAERANEFFGKLMKSHADAIKTVELAHSTVTDRFEPSTMRIKLDSFSVAPASLSSESAQAVELTDELIREAFESDGVPISPLDPPTGVELPRFDSHETSAQIRAWRRGDWFDLRMAGGVERVRLQWISPRRNLYVFAAGEGATARSLTRENLKAFVETGWLKPAEEARLFDRAVADVVGQLKRSATGAPDAG
jgi:hypothetical protein